MKYLNLRFTTLSSLAFAIIIAVLLQGCKASSAAKGGAIGVAAGGALGAVIGSKSDNTAAGAIIGAAVGGTTGALIGRNMDKQAEELRNDLKGAKVERIGEGIKITFDSGLLFNVDSYSIKNETERNLVQLASTLKKYEDTNILVEGHTDSSGSDTYNQTLSEQRAGSVSNYLVGQGVSSNRFNTVGYGESQPIASNESAQGKQSNRRVEVAIYANNKMKRMAKRGDL
jgi:outer membrane protein OmpA-like peptidoglycan-associated protein